MSLFLVDGTKYYLLKFYFDGKSFRRFMNYSKRSYRNLKWTFLIAFLIYLLNTKLRPKGIVGFWMLSPPGLFESKF